MPIEFKKMPELGFDNMMDEWNYQILLYGDAMDIGGGTITKEEIDIIGEHPEWKRISIAGLHQDTFEYFIHTYGAQFEAIYFFKNKFVHDLSALGTLKNIKAIGYFANQRAEKLWDMSGNKKLRMLSLNDFTRLHDLTGIETAPTLQYFDFGDKVWSSSEIHKLPDLFHCALEKIHYTAKVSYEDVYAFLQIKRLKQLDFPPNMYKVDFLAWIAANYPNVEGASLCPFRIYHEKTGTICGKHKPFIKDADSEKDKKRMENASSNFEKLKQKYQGISFEEILQICG